jgi:hypothetical protein
LCKEKLLERAVGLEETIRLWFLRQLDRLRNLKTRSKSVRISRFQKKTLAIYEKIKEVKDSSDDPHGTIARKRTKKRIKFFENRDGNGEYHERRKNYFFRC